MHKKEHILNECLKHQLTPIVTKAVDGKKLTSDFLVAEVYQYPECGLTPGEIGCALSHLAIYKKIRDENIKIAFVLEDDAVLDAKINVILDQIEQLDDATKPNIYLFSYTNDYRAKSLFEDKIANFSIHSFYNASCAHAYAINSLAAKNLCASLLPIKYEADRWSIFRHYFNINTYCVLPSIATVNDINKTHSNIEQERILNKRKRDLFIRKLTRQNKSQRIKYILWKLFVKPFLGIKKTGY